MKVTIAKNDLEGALSTTAHAMGKDAWTAHYFFRPIENGGVEVLTTNHRYCSSAPATCTFEHEEGEGEFTVEGNRIRTWLKNVTDGVPLILDTDGSVVRAKSVRGKVRWNCASASFPYWDDQLKEATSQCTIDVDTLTSVLGHGKHFVGKPDTKTLMYRYITVQDGGVLSGNGLSMALTLCPDLKGAKFYLTSLDLSPLLGFLKEMEGDIEILSTKRMVFFKGSNDAVFGLTMPSKKAVAGLGNIDVSKMNKTLASSVASWEVTTQDVISSLGLLSSSMAATDEVIKISFAQEELADGSTKVDLNIAGQSLAGDVDSLPVTLKAFNDDEDVLSSPSYFNRTILEKVLNLVNLPSIEVNVLKGLNNSPVIKHAVGGYETFSLVVPMAKANF